MSQSWFCSQCFASSSTSQPASPLHPQVIKSFPLPVWAMAWSGVLIHILEHVSSRSPPIPLPPCLCQPFIPGRVDLTFDSLYRSGKGQLPRDLAWNLECAVSVELPRFPPYSFWSHWPPLDTFCPGKLQVTCYPCPLPPSFFSPQLSASSAADSVVAPTSLPSSPYPSELRNLVFGADQFSLCFLAKLPVSGNLEFRTLPDFLGLQATWIYSHDLFLSLCTGVSVYFT